MVHFTGRLFCRVSMIVRANENRQKGDLDRNTSRVLLMAFARSTRFISEMAKSARTSYRGYPRSASTPLSLRIVV